MNSRYKLQEFVAHSNNVRCVNIGKKDCRLFITGGDDHTVKAWNVGKLDSLATLCGHTSPVECVGFDTAEIMVLGGASSGLIKLWDLEETKAVRTLAGHRSNCTAAEFHPFGEFFASGSSDAHLKIWDVRKKGCVRTHKGHTQSICIVRFTPDGRWVVSGGQDDVVKVWDLTAGKLLHEFKLHEGCIQSIDFHPLEFLLATGSADRTVKFWDLETFKLIGSTSPLASGVRALAFHPDGETIFCGLESSLQVCSWEPVIFHDAIDMGWLTLGDLCIHEGKLLGCSYCQNSVGIWASDIVHIKPYTASVESKEIGLHQKCVNCSSENSMEKSTLGLCSLSPDLDLAEIKNIYVDYGKPAATKGSINVRSDAVIFPLDSKEARNQASKKQDSMVVMGMKSSSRALDKSFVVPAIVPHDVPVTFSMTKPGMLLRPSHSRKSSMALQSRKFNDIPSGRGHVIGAIVKHEAKTTDTTRMLDDCVSLKFTSNENDHMVEEGKTRSLVERFERYERFINEVDDQTSSTSQPWPNMNRRNHSSLEKSRTSIVSPDTDKMLQFMNQLDKMPCELKEKQKTHGKRSTSAIHGDFYEDIMHAHEVFLNDLKSRLTKLQVVRRFWRRHDITGTITALKKLSDHAVEADFVSALIDKMDVLTLDMFACILPVLVGLLGSKSERHACVSMEMLLKLVAIFGPIIRATVSAPPTVGVDLHGQKRLECCNECLFQLQTMRPLLPTLVRQGGLLAKYAQELMLLLKES